MNKKEYLEYIKKHCGKCKYLLFDKTSGVCKDCTLLDIKLSYSYRTKHSENLYKNGKYKLDCKNCLYYGNFHICKNCHNWNFFYLKKA